MKLELLTRILDGVPNVRKEGTAWLVADEADLSIYIGLPSEVLTIARVSRISTATDLLTVETGKGERFYFTHDMVAGLKVGPSEHKGGGRGAGFR